MAEVQLNYTGAQINTLLAKIDTIANIIYPIGSIYMSVNSTSPATLFGGTWVRIEDTFLLAAGTTYAAGGTGGNTTHTLQEEELPSHTHGLNSHTHGAGTYAAVEVSDHTHNVQGFRSVASSSGGNPVVAYKKISGDAASTSTPVLSGGGHGHTISGTSGAASGNTEATGNGTAFSILPPYLAVYVWKRTA